MQDNKKNQFPNKVLAVSLVLNTGLRHLSLFCGISAYFEESRENVIRTLSWVIPILEHRKGSAINHARFLLYQSYIRCASLGECCIRARAVPQHYWNSWRIEVIWADETLFEEMWHQRWNRWQGNINWRGNWTILTLQQWLVYFNTKECGQQRCAWRILTGKQFTECNIICYNINVKTMHAVFKVIRLENIWRSLCLLLL